jgi:hypothetical protein
MARGLCHARVMLHNTHSKIPHLFATFEQSFAESSGNFIKLFSSTEKSSGVNLTKLFLR